MAAQIWDNDLGREVVKYWATVRRIYELTAIKGMSNTTTNVICNGILAEMAAQGGAYANATAANNLLIACAAGLAGNAFVGGA